MNFFIIGVSERQCILVRLLRRNGRMEDTAGAHGVRELGTISKDEWEQMSVDDLPSEGRRACQQVPTWGWPWAMR